MTNEQAIMYLTRLKDRINFEVTDAQGKMDALNMAIKALQEQADRNEFYNWDAPIRHKADGEYISKGKMLMFLNDMRFGIAPDETVADDDERRQREAQVDVLDDLIEVVEQMPTVDIPPDHDGCKDCVYQDNPQDAMPCRECKQNYMDKWKARPKEEPRYCDRNICLRNEYNGIGCDECEVGNPCLYCKHEFEPQERNEE